jgi:hypothetical protein
MPSRKVRRRRQKLKRHEYEYVVETDEGEEIPLERPAEREREADGRGARDAGPIDRRGRPLPKPTFQRSLRRTAMFAPFIALFLYITGGDELTVFGVIVNTLVILAFFLPFSYFVDRLIYNALVRRQQRARGARR